ncbi:hypothetical protein [Chitinophaga sp. Cy-1792]|uniref:hypothetical protein n=1 Tax=Chitinophaga sp. Cy-1792 TaxID=2608339 RepID=UPI001420A120|nr:hypothetical protein [Chitinophaga sp. Cy-1792]NIG55830.1 hypothetical protein [Chitinophaga sp. Cy-1792]
MTLLELVIYFRNGGTYQEFCQNLSLDKESEVIEIYVEAPYGFHNKLGFFSIEETKGSLNYNSNGSDYMNLFDFLYFLDTIMESIESNSKLTDEDLAYRLFEYAIKDA